MTQGEGLGGKLAMHPLVFDRPTSRHLTSPLTVGIHLRKRWSAWRCAADYSHGGSQGFKSPHLHPHNALVTGLADPFRRAGAVPDRPIGQ
jgi:hypothetical protein